MGLLSTIGAASGRAFGFTRSAIAAATDAFFNSVTLLLPGNGTNGAQNNTFLDSSSNNFTITRNGNTTQGTFSPFSQTGWSVQFDRADYNNLLISSSSDFDFSSGNFTIEMWINPQALPASGDGSFHWIFATTNLVAFFFSGNIYFRNQATTELVTPVAHGMSSGVWYHLAFVRSGSSYAIYRNGSSISTGSGGTVASGASALTIAGSSGYNGITACTLSNFRITNGQALYTSTFTPATAPLTTTSQGATASNVKLLTCQSNRFVDNSTQNTKTIQFGSGTTLGNRTIQAFSPFAPTAAYSAATVGGSGYFDGTGDNLAVPTNAANSVGSGSFYFEAWVYLTNPSAAQMIIADPSNTGGLFVGLNIDGGGRFAIGRTAVAVDNFVNLTWVGNQWYHLAVNRNGSSLQFFVNGTQVGSTGTNSVNYPSVGYRVGAEQAAGSAALTGYISGLRLVKSSVNTTNFTPPTAPPDASTAALCLQFTNAGITDATAKNVLETVGNAQISTTQSKFGGSSMYFDGTGDYAYAVSSAANSALGSGDWTVEFWLYTNAGSTTYNVIDWRPNATQGAYFSFYLNSGTPTYYTSSADRIVGGSAIPATTWTHVAVSRSGTSTRMFINGTQSGSTYTDTANYLGVVNRPAIGGGGSDTNNTLNGYIDDLRVTRGYARYTSNFTAPTAAFPVQ